MPEDVQTDGPRVAAASLTDGRPAMGSDNVPVPSGRLWLPGVPRGAARG